MTNFFGTILKFSLILIAFTTLSAYSMQHTLNTAKMYPNSGIRVVCAVDNEVDYDSGYGHYIGVNKVQCPNYKSNQPKIYVKMFGEEVKYTFSDSTNDPKEADTSSSDLTDFYDVFQTPNDTWDTSTSTKVSIPFGYHNTEFPKKSSNGDQIYINENNEETTKHTSTGGAFHEKAYEFKQASLYFVERSLYAIRMNDNNICLVGMNSYDSKMLLDRFVGCISGFDKVNTTITE